MKYWVNKDDVKENCVLFDIVGARVAKYVNDEVNAAWQQLLDSLIDMSEYEGFITQNELKRMRKEYE